MNNQSNDESRISEEQISELLNKVGSRPEPPAMLAEQIKAEVKQAWRENVESTKKKQSQRAVRIFFATAASLVVAVLLFLPTDLTPSNFASITKTVNAVHVLRNDQWQNISSLERSGTSGVAQVFGISEPIEIRTQENAFASIHMMNQLNLRVGAQSHIKVHSSSAIDVISGKVYIDSHDDVNNHNSISITTPYGSARDIGTQFAVEVSANSWTIQVREGEVEIQQENTQYRAIAGERILIGQDQTIQRVEITPHDESWHWTENVSDQFTLESATLSDYLTWISKETGLTFEYNSADIETAARATNLHGSVAGITPRESLEIVLSTTNFYVLKQDSGKLIISNR